MLPRALKIKKREFPLDIHGKKRRVYHSTLFTLMMLPRKKKENAKFSIVVSGKVSKKAVIRNTLKRTGYESIREYVKKIPSDRLFIFFLKKKAAEVRTRELKKEILEGIRNITAHKTEHS